MLFLEPLSQLLLQEDLEIAVDFFQYFFAMAELLDNDETILAVSAYNDIGQPQFVSDPSTCLFSHLMSSTTNNLSNVFFFSLSELLLRSDFFPGLGWMISRRTWDEIGPRWPEGFWDDWMREPHVRKGIHFFVTFLMCVKEISVVLFFFRISQVGRSLGRKSRGLKQLGKSEFRAHSISTSSCQISS